MPPRNPIAIFAPRLQQTGLSWMTVGSIAANAYGEFRVTNDLDLVLLMGRGNASQLADAFPEEEFYRPPVEVMEVEGARAQRGHFNLIHHQTGFKADIYLAGKDALHAWALERRRQVSVAGVELWLAPPEYVIIGKLEFYREGGSEKHVRDIRAMPSTVEAAESVLTPRLDAGPRRMQKALRNERDQVRATFAGVVPST